MDYTGVFATKEEIQTMKHAVSQPYIKVFGHWPENPQEVAHRLALSHGLPEIEGYYGCDLRTGEFVKCKNKLAGGRSQMNDLVQKIVFDLTMEIARLKEELEKAKKSEHYWFTEYTIKNNELMGSEAKAIEAKVEACTTDTLPECC